MKNQQGEPVDKYGQVIRSGDWVCFISYRDIYTGFVVGFTKSGNPRVFEYHGHNDEFSSHPTAVGVNSGVIKISPITDKVPEAD